MKRRPQNSESLVPRTQAKEFKRALQTGFGTDLFGPCWVCADVERVRLVRNVLSHSNGRETPPLKGHGHGIRVLDGVLQIFPENIRALLHTLQGAVDALVGPAVGLPQIAAPAH